VLIYEQMMTLADELDVIDQTIDELESRRVELIHKMVSLKTLAGGQNVIEFPGSSVTVRDSGSNLHAW
jgi:hypothetical protein